MWGNFSEVSPTETQGSLHTKSPHHAELQEENGTGHVDGKRFGQIQKEDRIHER